MDYLLVIFLAIIAGLLTFKQVGVKHSMKSVDQEIEEYTNNGPSMILLNRKLRRFMKRMSKGKLDLKGRTEGPMYMVLQVQGLMNTQMSIPKKRIEFNILMAEGVEK